MARLSKTQRALLQAAADRGDRNLLPTPQTLDTNDSALDRTLIALVRRGFAEERRVADAKAAWREAADGECITLFITAKGLAAIGVEHTTGPAAEDGIAMTAPVNREPGRPRGKLGAVLGAIERDAGATLAELTVATGWLPHTTRAALTRLRQRGFDIRLETADGRRAYRIGSAA